MQQSAGRISGVVAGGAETHGQDDDDRDEPDLRSVGERFAASEEVKRFLAGGGKQSERVKMGAAMSPRLLRSQAAYSGEGYVARPGGPAETHALVATGSPTYLVPPMIVPGIFRPRDYALTMREVLVSGRTNSDTIYFLRELLFTNNAVEVAQATASTGSSGTKPESALTFEQASAPVVTIAHWIPITRQAIADAAQLQTYVENRLLVGLERRANSAILNGDGTGANMLGILNTSGVQVLDGTYFAGAPVNNAGTDNENFERVARAMTQVELVGDSLATFVTMNPRDIEAFMTTTNAQREYLGGGPFVTGGVRTIWGLPIAKDRGIPQGTALVGDGTMAAVWDREDANILIDTINDQFIRNMLTILAELRIALTVFRPAGFAVVSLA